MSVKALEMRRSASPLHDRPHARRLDQVDPYLLIATLLLIGYGLVMTYAVTVDVAPKETACTTSVTVTNVDAHVACNVASERKSP